MQKFEIFECSGQNSSNSTCQFWTGKSIPLKFLHHSYLPFNYAKKIPCLLLYSFQWKERLFKSRKSLFFFSVARTILKVIPNGNEWNLKAGISSEENLFLNRYFILFSFSFQSHLPLWTKLIPTILLSHLAWRKIL